MTAICASVSGCALSFEQDAAADATGAGDAGALTEPEYCALLNGASCDFRIRCCGASADGGCDDLTMSTCLAIAPPDGTFNQDEARHVVNVVVEAMRACSFPRLGIPYHDPETIAYDGTLPRGDTCYDFSGTPVCGPELDCVFDGGPGSGTCEATAHIGEVCNETTPCAWYLFCRAGICTAEMPVGGACEVQEECESFCDTTGHCAWARYICPP